MFCHLGIRSRLQLSAIAEMDVNNTTPITKMTRPTAPAQNISDGHQLWFGGSAACEGNELARDAVGLGVAVATVDVEVD
jgi:hypothetical protein